MVQSSLLKNYQKDLEKSRKNPLLIELNKKDLIRFEKEFIDKFNSFEKNKIGNFPKEYSLGNILALLSAKEIYDISLKNKSATNLIVVDTNKITNNNSSILLEQIVEQIDDSLKKLYNLEIAKEGIKAGLSIATKGISNLFEDFINEGVSKSIDFISDTVSNEIGIGIADTVIDTIAEELTDYAIDEIKENIFLKINTKTINILDGLKDTQLYLSKESKDRLLAHSKKINSNLSNAELYQLILKLIIDIAIDMPIAIYINNPHKLDTNSIALLSLLLSVSKNLKDENHHIGVSIIYAYDNKEFQPYQQCIDKYRFNQELLDEQRLFAQRYAMLERPSSDIPNIAVKSHMFVGREEELEILKDSYNDSKENKKRKATMQVIAAEPGIGKTKLAKKHFESIRNEEDNGQKLIQLTLLNQVGHNSSNTGLSSLINSILDEVQRLNNVKTLTEKLTDKIKEKTSDTLLDMIKDIFDSGTIDTTKAIYDRANIDNKMHEFSKTNLENSSENSKEKQFEKINQAIKKIELISDDSMPIVLFIDDLQWIDDISAEYILNHFIKKFNVHIVSTLRSSDANTILKSEIDNKSQEIYKISFRKIKSINRKYNSF